MIRTRIKKEGLILYGDCWCDQEAIEARKEYSRKWHAAKTAERRRNEHAVASMKAKRRRNEWIKANGPCRRCGTWEKLAFDHIDPKSKEYKISTVWLMSEEIRLAELAKCQVLCSACHARKTVYEDGGGKKPQSHCKRGHALTPDNLYFDKRKRQCKACVKINSEKKRKAPWNFNGTCPRCGKVFQTNPGALSTHIRFRHRVPA